MEHVEEYVDRYYQMDPETEDMVPSGDRLKNGMRVLIAQPSLRENVVPERLAQPDNVANAQVWNRWCIVTHVTTWSNSRVTFVGIYDNGVKLPRNVENQEAWIVKKDSIPVESKTGVGFDAIVRAGMMILNDTREACLAWMRENRDSSETVFVAAWDRQDLISGTQYLVLYG